MRYGPHGPAPHEVFEGRELRRHRHRRPLRQVVSEDLSPPASELPFPFHGHLYKAYNPTGKFQAADYRFPFEDSTFDLFSSTSVFTPCWHETWRTTSPR